ncbi:MAG TPA: peptidoglycan-associated lipoprotein Pal [Nitrococcus sp.]|nr:peptidoglycan-associated lipoprotein Pal [Nitrococcus sp.]
MRRLTFQMAALLLVAALALVSGCSTTGSEQAGARGVSKEGGAAGAEGVGAAASGAQNAPSFQGTELGNAASPLSQRVIYFDFDSNVVKPQYMPVLKAHGEYLATHPEKQVTVEGHTDERGSSEYNLALGERRAKAVQRILELNGAAGQQVNTVSYGEEKPADPGHNEAAWAKNRRAVIVYHE